MKASSQTNEPHTGRRLTLRSIMVFVAYCALAFTPFGSFFLILFTHVVFGPFYFFHRDCVDAYGRATIRLAAIIFICVALTWAIVFLRPLFGASPSRVVVSSKTPADSLLVLMTIVPVILLGVLVAMVVGRPGTREVGSCEQR